MKREQAIYDQNCKLIVSPVSYVIGSISDVNCDS